MGVPYPENVTGAIALVIEIIEEGKIAERNDEFTKSLWEITGMSLKLSLGDPDDLSKGIESVYANPESYKQAFVAQTEELAKVLEELDEQDVPHTGVNVASLMSLVRLLLELLRFTWS